MSIFTLPQNGTNVLYNSNDADVMGHDYAVGFQLPSGGTVTHEFGAITNSLPSTLTLAGNTLQQVEADNGTGSLIEDPMQGLHLFHFGGDGGEGGGPTRLPLPIRRNPLPVVDPLPHVIHTGPEKANPGTDPGAIAGPWFGGVLQPNPESGIVSQTGLDNAGSWANAVSGMGPDANILGILQQSAGKGGANLQLGPQADFAPAGDPGGGGPSGGGGMGGILFVGLAIVGALVYFHFKHKKASSGAQTA